MNDRVDQGPYKRELHESKKPMFLDMPHSFMFKNWLVDSLGRSIPRIQSEAFFARVQQQVRQ